MTNSITTHHHNLLYRGARRRPEEGEAGESGQSGEPMPDAAQGEQPIVKLSLVIEDIRQESARVLSPTPELPQAKELDEH